MAGGLPQTYFCLQTKKCYHVVHCIFDLQPSQTLKGRGWFKTLFLVLKNGRDGVSSGYFFHDHLTTSSLPTSQGDAKTQGARLHCGNRPPINNGYTFILLLHPTRYTVSPWLWSRDNWTVADKNNMQTEECLI